VKVHALVEDVDGARAALDAGATVVQLRVKGAGTVELVEAGRAVCVLCKGYRATFVVNDDVQAALVLGADGVHLGAGDTGMELALSAGLLVGWSAANVQQAVTGSLSGAAYVGAGPVWPTPTKGGGDEPIGLDGLAAICEAVDVPVVAIGGVDASNARDCIRAGAAGVAVVRAAGDPKVRAAVDDAR